jgi:glycerol kinase
MAKLILAIDQGTTSSKAFLINREGKIVGQSGHEFQQIYPQPGWVEHNPLEIWESQKRACHEVLRKNSVKPSEIAAIGITNQRETAVVWEKTTGKPISNAIVWQCRRTSPLCERLREQGKEDLIREKTGLMVDAYFSGTKVQWILENVPGAMKKAERGDLCFGTIDSWLIYNLTAGRLHITDPSNASRTMLLNIHSGDWDAEILNWFGIPKSMLPAVVDSSALYGETTPEVFGGVPIPIAGIAGDQQAALFGQTCFRKGEVKNTYGTGCFVLANIGERPVRSKGGLIVSVAWRLKNRWTYVLEGGVFIAGAAVQWLRDGLGVIKDSREIEDLARKVPDTGGVYFLPAFVGLGAPYWDMYTRGMISGITRGTNAAHLARATLESIAYQTKDIIECMEINSGLKISELRVDGGAAENNLLMQFQADILGIPVIRPQNPQTTAIGAAYLAGLGTGFWNNLAEIEQLGKGGDRFIPTMSELKRNERYKTWQKLVEIARLWGKP